MTDPLDTLREPVRPVDPDPGFASELRARLERTIWREEREPMTTAEQPVRARLGTLTPTWR